MNKLKLILTAAMVIAASSQAPVLGLTLTQSATAPSAGVTESQTVSGTATIQDHVTNQDNGVGDTFQVFSPTETGTGYDNAAELLAVTVEDTATTGIGNQTYTLTIYSVSGANGSFGGGTATAIDTESVSSSLSANKQFLTFTLSDYVQLTAGNVYLFTLSSGTTGITLASDGTTGQNYTGGLDLSTARAASVSAGAVSDTGNGTGSLVFFLDTVPVPEPADWALVPVIGTITFFGLRRLRFTPVAA